MGTWFSLMTSTVKVWEKYPLSVLVEKSSSIPASSTVTVMVAVPIWSATGVNFRVPALFGEV